MRKFCRRLVLALGSTLLVLVGVALLFGWACGLDAHAQTVTQETIAGNLSAVGTAGRDVLQARFSLVNCGSANPVVAGVTSIVAKVATFTAASNGSISGSLWGNDQVTCNMGMSTEYQVTYLRNGVPTGIPSIYRVTGTVQPWNLSTAVPVTVLPALSLLASGFTCPTGQALIGVQIDWTPLCGYENTTTIGGTNGNFTAAGMFFGQGLNNVQFAIPATGGDLGAAVNAAFAACGNGTSCVVELEPNQTYTYTTQIQVPGAISNPSITRPELHCNGSTLNFAGTGDAIVVHGENGAGPATTGGIYNCLIAGDAPHSARVTSLIHIKGRLGFTLSRLQLSNAANCVDWENENDDGGPGYSEDDEFEHMESAGCANHLYAHAGPGATSSYEYDRIYDWHFTLSNANGAENGLAMVGGTTGIQMQGALLDLRMNSGGDTASATATSIIYLSNASQLFRSDVFLHGENTGGIPNAYAIYVTGGSVFNNDGGLFVDTNQSIYVSNPEAGDQAFFHPTYTTITNDIDSGALGTHVEDETGRTLQRRCKFDTLAYAVRFWLADNDPQPDCSFQVLARTTDNTNQDVYTKGTGNAEVNIFYTDGHAKSVGIGAGFGPTATGGEEPLHNLDVHGDFAVDNPALGTPADGGALAQRKIDGSGNLVDYFSSGLPGQPSNHHLESWHDYSTFTTFTGRDCYANTGNLNCTLFGNQTVTGKITAGSYTETLFTPATSSATCTAGQFADDANYHYVCTATNTWKRVALVTF